VEGAASQRLKIGEPDDIQKAKVEIRLSLKRSLAAHHDSNRSALGGAHVLRLPDFDNTRGSKGRRTSERGNGPPAFHDRLLFHGYRATSSE
jgi:hypothetical protein